MSYQVEQRILKGICNYQDLGLVIDATNMAAGATVWETSFHDGVEWVRNIKTLINCDQQFDITVMTRTSDGTTDGGYALLTNLTATPGSFRPYTFIPQNAGIASSILGYSAKFGLKNSAASPNTIGKLRVQLMGA